MGTLQRTCSVLAAFGLLMSGTSCGSAGKIVASDARDSGGEDRLELSSELDYSDESGPFDPCRRPCEDSECGPDLLGCGAFCGVCNTGECLNGHCSCTGRFLPCGESCCAPGEICMGDGKCCSPACTGRSCGGDGCGGSCGNCDGPGVCTADGICELLTCGSIVCPVHPQMAFMTFCNQSGYCEYIPNSGDENRSEIFVPPGSFEMGLRGEDCMFEEQLDIDTFCAVSQPAHEVTFTKGYFIGKYEVTLSRYKECILSGSCGAFDESGAYCFDSWDAEGKNVYVYDVLPVDAPAVCLAQEAAAGFCFSEGTRLPSEAEWEMALKGPEYSVYAPGLGLEDLCGEISCCGCSGTLLPVGASPGDVSAIGARDMVGNAKERVLDCWHIGYAGAPVDGTPFDWNCSSGWLVNRGGGVATPAKHLFTSARSQGSSSASGLVGFRCVRDL